MNGLLMGLVGLHALCAQVPRLPGIPVVNDELLAEMKDPPTLPSERESALAALFRQAGAEDAEIRWMELPDSAKQRIEGARQEATRKLKEAGAPQAEIDAAVATFDRRQGALGRNLIVTLPGRTDRVLGFGAHVDAAENSQGVIDDWSGCVLLTNLYQTLKTSRPRHSLWFVAFAEQELGCLGSSAWAESLDPAMVEKLDAFVVIDCVGVCSPMAWWSGSSASVVELAADAATRFDVPLKVVDFPGASSDSLCVRSRGIPTLSLLGIDPPHVPLLHGPGDRFDAIVPARIDETYRLLRALAADFDETMQPLHWDYAKEKLRLGDPASGRTPLQPIRLDLGAAPPASAPPADPPKKDGSHP